MSEQVENKGTVESRGESKGFLARMQTKWGVSLWGAIAILLAFALAGSTVLKISGPILNLLLPDDYPKWLWWVLRIGIIVPVYEVLLLSFGTLLGQRKFFWKKQVAIFQRLSPRRNKQS